MGGLKIMCKNYSLYRHTSPSGKVYIGITSQPVEHRWNNGKGYMNIKKGPFKNTIIKYGWDNIKHEVLFTNLSEGLAKHLEMELIRHYKNLGISLNITDGGDGLHGCVPWNKGKKVPYEKSNKRKGCHLTEEHKKKLSLAHKGKHHKGHKWTKKQRELFSKVRKGVHISDAQKQKIRKHSAKSKVMLEFNTVGEIINRFSSASEAARRYNLDASWIAKACRNRVICSGHIFMYEDDIVDIKEIKPSHYRTGNTISIINMITGEIKTFNSKTDCAKFLGYKQLSSLNKNINSGRKIKDNWRIAI